MELTRRTFTFGTMGAAGLVGGVAARPAQAQSKIYKMKLGTPFLLSHPGASRVVEACDKIRAETKGVIDIEVFPGNQLGGESDMQSQLRAGAIDFMTTSGVLLQTLVATAGVNGLPFVFKDYGTVWPAMDGDLGAMIRAAIDKIGLHTFPKAVDNGFRNITTSNKPIEKPDDLKGLKIRIPVTPLWVSSFKALGASPTTMNLTELYSALQTKVVDGQENPLVQIDTYRLFEVQKYCSMTGHVWDGNWLIANGRKWTSLPKDGQEVIARCFDDAAVKQREDIVQLNTSLEKSLKDKGMIFNYPDKAPFRDALQKAGFYAEWKTKYGADAWAKLEQYCGVLA
jgi:TRAP-type transport system periplasmic protein